MNKHIRGEMTAEELAAETPEEKRWRMAMRENKVVAKVDADMKALQALPEEERRARAEELVGPKPPHMVKREEEERAKVKPSEPVDTMPTEFAELLAALEAGRELTPVQEAFMQTADELGAFDARVNALVHDGEPGLGPEKRGRLIGDALARRNELHRAARNLKLNGTNEGKGH
jgi:hypothetical protein